MLKPLVSRLNVLLWLLELSPLAFSHLLPLGTLIGRLRFAVTVKRLLFELATLVCEPLLPLICSHLSQL
jgi:hypothetical protein